LTKTDSVTIQNGLTQFVRAPAEVADTTARRQCGEMVAKFRERLGARKVFRGAYDSPGGDAHYGGAFDGHIHFDPQTLADAEKGVPGGLRELINTALHEAAHTLGIMHPNEFDATGHYSDPYFNLLDSGSNTCLK
jgi:hypothetical protein